MDTDTYYDLLGVTPDAGTEEIKAAYDQLSMRIRPDSGGTDALFSEVKKAYDTLSDPAFRHQYDDSLSNQTEIYGNDNQEYNASGWVRVDDTPAGSDTSEPGHDGGHANSPPPHTEYDGAYGFNFNGNDENQMDFPPPHTEYDGAYGFNFNGNDENQMDFPPPHTEYDGAYGFNFNFDFTGHDGGHANSPPPHREPWHTPQPSGPPRGDASEFRHDTEDPSHTPPPSGSPPGRNGFSSGDTPSGYPRHEQSSHTKVIVILLAVVYIVLLSNSQPVLFALLMLSLPIVGFIAIFIKWRKKWIGK
ncbi:MAG: DnaJ domain-containing protein [Actinobacteria bacterium]|nr:DnaJ domain-containing protein [Actinomycetota bacterium]MCL5446908.1 DnaJ domain-containing protein [Actinomycetota bacterium]